MNYFMSNLLYNDYILYLMHFKVVYNFLHENVLHMLKQEFIIYTERVSNARMPCTHA